MEFHRSHMDTKRADGHAMSILLPRRSLLIFTDELYSDYLHSIPARDRDLPEPKLIVPDQACAGVRATRVSLTLRVVS